MVDEKIKSRMFTWALKVLVGGGLNFIELQANSTVRGTQSLIPKRNLWAIIHIVLLLLQLLFGYSSKMRLFELSSSAASYQLRSERQESFPSNLI